MATNRDLLKEAIADAKSVKEVAIANAKLALEEAFTPFLKDQLSAKLQEMDDEDVKKEEIEEVEEVTAEGKKKEDEVVKEDEVNLDELLAELENSDIDEAKNSEDKEDIKDMSQRKKDKADPMKEDERTDAEQEGYEDGMEDEKEDMDDEEIDLEDMSEDDLKGFIEDVIKDMVADGEIEPGDEFVEDEVEVEDSIEIEDVEDVDVDVEIDEEMKASEKNDEKVKEAKVDLDEESKKEKEEGDDREPYSKRSKASQMTLDMSRTGKGDSQMVKELEAALASVNELKTELNEVNLLNAKLLYTNKIFKAKNLTEDKKVKVLKAFDKAVDVRQAKTIFETLTEGLVDKVSKPSINESIKRGSSSKATGLEPKATKQPIIESNEVFDRMRKLAGLI